MKSVINRRGFATAFMALIAGAAVQPASSQRGRRDTGTPEDSQTSLSTDVCVVMEEREGALVLEGHGEVLSEPFTMSAGRYRLEVEFTRPGKKEAIFSVDFIHRASGDEEVGIKHYFDEESTDSTSGSVEFEEDGEYLAETKFYSGDWKIVLSPI